MAGDAAPAGGRDERLLVETAAGWRAWLTEHHATSPGVWVVRWKPSSGRPVLGYEPLVEEALAFGWIDATQRTVDDERTEMWFTRRRPGSGWSRLTKERLARVEASGRMTDAGRAVVEAARADGSWTLYDDAEAGVVPDDLSAALQADAQAGAGWRRLTPGVQRAQLRWLAEARRPQTRAGRVERIASAAAAGRSAR
ncbi:YdeI/OmpD-associated family protein [Cellulomonas sp.]|uniref:YdeI/OmpD-associated family protein n=1 Tax=Cellulomonas sp. TaxID=40001 RepID=UPI0028122DE5|nr:YdeI/OmpD-associated family protein [Cellulomonas sp.]